MKAVGALCLLAALSVACGPRAAEAPSAREYTGPIVDSEKLRPGFLWQQEITASRGPFSHGFPAAVQSADGVLTILGLTPFGTRAFVIEQRGQTFEYRTFVEQELPIRPEWVLIDVHRTFFDGFEGMGDAVGGEVNGSGVEGRGVEGPGRGERGGEGREAAKEAASDRAASNGAASNGEGAALQPLPDGVHERVRDGERRRDRWEAGRLRERTYERLDAPGSFIRIDYGAGYTWGAPPPELRFENDWYGYRLDVRTTHAETIE